MPNEKDNDPGSKPVDAPTARRRQDAIGRRLRQMYEEVVSEPVPDDFLSFLKQADKSKAPPDSQGGASSKNK